MLERDDNKYFNDYCYIPFENNFDITKDFQIDKMIEDSVNLHFKSCDIKDSLNFYKEPYEYNIETIPSYETELFAQEPDDFMKYDLYEWECFDNPYMISDVYNPDNIELVRVVSTIKSNVEEYLVESWEAGYDPNIIKIMTDFQLSLEHLILLLDQLISLQSKKTLNIIEDITGEFRIVKYNDRNIGKFDIFYLYFILFLRFFIVDFEIEFKLIDFSIKN